MGRAARRRAREAGARPKQAADAMSVHEPGGLPALEALHALDRLRQVGAEYDRVARERDEAIRSARAAGATWTELSRVLGVSPQAVQQKYGR